MKRALALVTALRLCLPPLAPAASLAVALPHFIAKHCADCHGPETQKAGLRLDTLATTARLLQSEFPDIFLP